MNAKDIVKKYNDLKGRRANWDAHWRDTLDYVLPEHNNVYGQYAPGVKKGITVFDNTPTQANEILASALHGMLTNPASYWFWLRTGDPKIDQQDDVRAWLQSAAVRMHEVMNQSNFQTEIHEVYQGLGAIGCWTLFIDEDDEHIVRFLARPIYQSYIEENSQGYIDTIYRYIKWKWYMVKQKWPDSPAIEKMSSKITDEEDVEIIHAVEPRSQYDNQGLPKKFKYASGYALLEHNLMISESGYREFPYCVPRWSKVSGEEYGRGPAMKCLADIKMLNKIMSVQIRGLEKTVDPPLLVPNDGVIFPLRLIPGGLNFIQTGLGETIKPLITDARVDYGFQALEELRKRIKAMFFIDQLQLAEGPQMTATEVNKRTEEKLRLMGPILGRLHHELLKPLIDRVFMIMLRKGELPPNIPAILSKKKLQIQYSSLIAKAQKTSEADNISRMVQIAQPFVQADPTIMDKVDGEKVIDYLAETYDLPEEIIRSDADIKKIRDQRQKAQQAAQQAQAQSQQAENIGKAGPVMLQAAQQGQGNG